jgi:hypothetical protein
MDADTHQTDIRVHLRPSAVDLTRSQESSPGLRRCVCSQAQASSAEHRLRRRLPVAPLDFSYLVIDLKKLSPHSITGLLGLNDGLRRNVEFTLRKCVDQR